MGYCRQTALPVAEPVTLPQARNFLRISAMFNDDDDFILGLIQAAREYAEASTGRAIAQRAFRMVLDAHPYYTDTVSSGQAYPSSYYSLPLYATTMWNYSQMIKLPFAPVISVEQMRSIQPDGTVKTMHQDTDFILDRMSEPARIFPLPGSYWPPDLYVANALEIDFTAGYDPDPTKTDTHTAVGSSQQPDSVIVTGIPQSLRSALLMLIAHWYDNRWAVTKDNLKEVPLAVTNLLSANMVMNFAPTRG